MNMSCMMFSSLQKPLGNRQPQNGSLAVPPPPSRPPDVIPAPTTPSTPSKPSGANPPNPLKPTSASARSALSSGPSDQRKTFQPLEKSFPIIGKLPSRRAGAPPPAPFTFPVWLFSATAPPDPLPAGQACPARGPRGWPPPHSPPSG